MRAGSRRRLLHAGYTHGRRALYPSPADFRSHSKSRCRRVSRRPLSQLEARTALVCLLLHPPAFHALLLLRLLRIGARAESSSSAGVPRIYADVQESHRANQGGTTDVSLRLLSASL